MTSKREWKRRALTAHELKFQAFDAMNEALRQRDTAIAERDRARDTACALESDVARLRDSLRVIHRMLGNLLDHDTEIRDSPLAEWERELLAVSNPWPNVGASCSLTINGSRCIHAAGHDGSHLLLDEASS